MPNTSLLIKETYQANNERKLNTIRQILLMVDLDQLSFEEANVAINYVMSISHRVTDEQQKNGKARRALAALEQIAATRP